MARSDAFRAALRARFDRALAEGRPHVDVQAGELHREVGGLPKGADQSMPMCCRVMRREMREGDSILDQPRKGRDGPTVLIRYRLPRTRPLLSEAPEPPML